MPPVEDLTIPRPVYSFQKVDGILALDKGDILTEEDLSEGDRISWFSLPDGRLLVCKNPEGTPIKRISSAYIHLDPEVNLEEK